MTPIVAVCLCGLAIVLVTAVGLVTSADWLVVDLLGSGLPLGTLATAVSMTILPALVLPLARSGWTRGAAWLLIMVSVAWLPVSAVIAGNLRLEFTDGPEHWWTVTQRLPMLSLLLLVGVSTTAIGRHWRHRDRPSG